MMDTSYSAAGDASAINDESSRPVEQIYSAGQQHHNGGGGGGHDAAYNAFEPAETAFSPDLPIGQEENVFELDAQQTAAAIAALPPPAASPSPESEPASAPTSALGTAVDVLAALPMTVESWANVFWATASNRERLMAFCYSRSLLLSAGTQLFLLFLFAIIEPTAIKYHVTFSATMTTVVVLCQFVQLCIIVLAHLGMLKELTALYVRPAKIWNMYVSTVLAFAALYFTFFCFQRTSFQVDGYAPSGADDDTGDENDPVYEDVQTSNNIAIVYVYFFYFSGAIMTSTGFGDIAPTLWYSQLATNAQMLIGTMYHVGVFGLTLSHFRTFQKVAEERAAAARAAPPRTRIEKWWRRFASQAWVIRLRTHPRINAIKAFCIRHLVFVCLVFQVLNALILFSIPDPFRSLPSSDPGWTRKIVVLTFLALFQTAMFLGVMYISIRVVKQVNNANITPGFLVQSFLATALLFGGIYFVLFAATPNHQFSRHTAFDLTIYEVLYVFVHFSLTVMTTTGFGDVYARGIIARSFVLLQMLISILYSAVIIGLGTSQLIDMQAAKAEADMKRKAQEILEARQREAELRRGTGTSASSPMAAARGHTIAADADVNLFEVPPEQL